MGQLVTRFRSAGTLFTSWKGELGRQLAMAESMDKTIEVEQQQLQGPLRLHELACERKNTQILQVGQALAVGSSAEAEWQFQDKKMSRLHCRVELTPRGLLLTDLQSRNGTYVGFLRVRQVLLSHFPLEISMGDTTICVEECQARPVQAPSGLVGVSEGMQRVRELIGRFAALRAPVLIRGESGVGKDLVARALHAQSNCEGAYVPLNAAAFPDSLLDSELFGHARGAFTGAVSPRRGAFELAHLGTLFLDEVGEMSPAGQVKLLRVIEEGRVRPLGASQWIDVETRVVSATCAPLERWIKKGQFREDLFHRLSMLELEVPPLRRRKADIPVLVRNFFEQRQEELGRRSLTEGAVQLLMEQAWPGNVRQLFGVLYRAASMSSGEVLGVSHFQTLGLRWKNGGLPEREQLRRWVEVHGSVSAAARAAGIPRSSFRGLLRRAAVGEGLSAETN